MRDLRIEDPTGVAEARRVAVAAAEGLGFDAVRNGQLALVASELASNLVKHAGGGRLLIETADHHVDLIALDRGPGMANVDACLADGYSSAGTAGNGLGAVRRLAQAFEVVSVPGRGTAVHARVLRQGLPTPAPEGVGGIVVPKPGETACGDAWAWHDDADARTVFMVDGLGHGTEAAVAAHEAVRQFHRSPDAPPEQILHGVHQAIRHTRGGAVAVARIDRASQTLAYAGLGNIAGAILAPGGQIRRLVSHNGTAGHVARKIQAFDYPCAGGTLVMHTDGIGSGWSLDARDGLGRAHPLLLAGLVYRDAARGRDDAAVAIARSPT